MLCKDSPIGSRMLKTCLLGAPNAGKSSILNLMVNRKVSAVSNKYNTTTDPTLGVYTDQNRKT